MTGAALARLLDALDGAAGTLGPFTDPAEEADAHRHLLRLLSAALDLHVERADPARPLPTVWMSPTRKFLGDSPDTTYTTVPVSADHAYRLTVDPGPALYVGLVAYARDDVGGAVRIADSVVDRDLVGEDGRYVVPVGSDVAPDDASGLTLDDRTFWVMVRHYFADPRHAGKPLVDVERTDGVAPDRPPEPEVLAARIDAAADWVGAQLRADTVLDGLIPWAEGSIGVGDEAPDVPDDLVSLFFPTPDIEYQGCRARLGDGQVLEARLRPPPCRYWSLTLGTPWFESVENRHAPASVSSERGAVEPDGSVRVVVAEHDPGAANWLPRRGYRRVQLAYRVLLGESEPEPPVFRVIDAP